MNKKFKYFIHVVLFCLLSSETVGETTVYSCDGRSVSGSVETLEPKIYHNTKPTIILGPTQLEFFYLKNGIKFQTTFEIISQDENFIVGIEVFKPDKNRIFHFHKKDKIYSFAYLGYNGNNMKYGKCYQ